MAETIITLCKSGRLHAIVQTLLASTCAPNVYALSDVRNPYLVPPDRFYCGKTDDPEFIKRCIKEIKPKPTLAIIGPEEPLATGIADLFWKEGIPCVGPLKALARLETSKAFTRKLMMTHGIPGCPEHQIFDRLDGIGDYIGNLGDFVIKPDGLTGGKGVKVSGEHLHSIAEAVEYCAELFREGQPSVIVEEKLDGEEFSFQSFFDGQHGAHMVPVQDHKRAWDGDKGSNTGGMGSYSFANHLLPFLTPEDVQKAGEINLRIGEALLKETGLEYKGILYGGFMLTKNGLRVIEYNARFGDPEIMNVLPIMETDFVDVCKAIVTGTLDKLDIRFERKATVCKYVVPRSYPGKLRTNSEIDITELEQLRASERNLRVYYGAVEAGEHGPRLTGSRAIGVVGLGPTLNEAERIAEKAASCVKGEVYHRKDIGTSALIEKREKHMERIHEQSADHLRAIGTLASAAG
jgi:phosphoribosylamine---glycine ligase